MTILPTPPFLFLLNILDIKINQKWFSIILITVIILTVSYTIIQVGYSENKLEKNSLFQNHTISKLYLGYGPYHGQFHPIFGPHPTKQDIKNDFEKFHHFSDHIRIYSASGIAYSIMEIASQYGITVDVGLNLGKDTQHNQREIDNLFKITSDFEGTIGSVIVANDTFLYEKMEKEQLIQIIEHLREKLPPGILLTLANPADGWADNPEIIKILDYVMVHSYPYWFGQDVSFASTWIDNELDYMTKLVKRINPESYVVIGETGWASDGKTICNAVPSPENQLSYFSQMNQIRNEKNIDIFLYGVFDESWKRDFNVKGIDLISNMCGKKSVGIVDTEANFGIFTNDGKLKPSLAPFFIPIASYAKSYTHTSENIISIHTNDFKYTDSNDVSYIQIKSNSTKPVSIDIQKDDNTSTIETALPHTIITSANQNVKITINNPENHTLDIMQYGLPEIFAVCELSCTLLKKSTEQTDQFISWNTSNKLDEYLLPIMFWIGITFLAISLLGYSYLQNRRMQHVQ